MESPPEEGSEITPGVVVRAEGRSLVVRAGGRELEAELALVGAYAPRAQDRVLVARSGERAWIIGVLGALRSAPEPATEPASGPAVLRAADGSRAELAEGGEALLLRDPEGRLLLEHREGSARLYAPGDLAIEAGGALSLRGRSVSLEAPSEGGPNGLRLDDKGATIESPELEARAGEARLGFDAMSLASRSVTAAIEQARVAVEVAETRAGRIVERAKNVYREVDELAQLRAGRLRTIALGAMHLVAGRAAIRADEDVSIQGEKIHLG